MLSHWALVKSTKYVKTFNISSFTRRLWVYKWNARDFVHVEFFYTNFDNPCTLGGEFQISIGCAIMVSTEHDTL